MNRKVLSLCAFVFLACSREKTPSPDSTITVAPGSARVPPAPVSSGVPGCEHTGQWEACSLERRLKQSGFVVKRLDDAVERNGFSVKPVAYALGSSRLEAFFYKNEAAAAKDIAGLDTLTATPAGTPSQWPSTPTVVRSANLIAVYLGQSPRQSERFALAITAGPPQPGSPR
ncbi:MAG TPA: hypothetical protein VF042_05610 [Gemmatimonadaceae bacterium]